MEMNDIFKDDNWLIVDENCPHNEYWGCYIKDNNLIIEPEINSKNYLYLIKTTNNNIYDIKDIFLKKIIRSNEKIIERLSDMRYVEKFISNKFLFFVKINMKNRDNIYHLEQSLKFLYPFKTYYFNIDTLNFSKYKRIGSIKINLFNKKIKLINSLIKEKHNSALKSYEEKIIKYNKIIIL
jgi:hypothetical protein